MLTSEQKVLLDILLKNYKRSSFCIKGNAGSGKSYLLKEFKKNLETEVSIFDNNILNEIIKSRFNILEYKSLYSKELKANFFSSILKIFFNSFNNKFSSINNIISKYGESQAQILFFFTKYLEKYLLNNNTLVFDNLNFWDDLNISVLDILIFDESFKKSFLLSNIIVAYSESYYMSNSLKNLIKKIENNDNNFSNFELKSLNKNELKEYMINLRIDKLLVNKYIHIIYDISLNSNLALINASCNYLRNNGSFAKENIQKDINNVMTLLLLNEIETEHILTSASLFKEPFTKDDLTILVQDIFKYENEVTENSILKGINKNILSYEIFNDMHYLDFVDKIFSQYLRNKNNKENLKYYKAFSKLLEKIFSSQYYKRHEYNKLAMNFEESNTLYMLYIISEYRNGNFNIYIKSDFKEKSILKIFSDSYKSFYMNNEDSSLDALIKLDFYTLDKRIIFEKDYLLSLIKLEIADQDSFNELYKRNIKWKEEIPLEKELLIRAEYILFMIDMYKKEDITFNERLSSLIRIIDSSRYVDNTLNLYIYSLKRRTRMRYEPEIASLKSQESVSFFEKNKNKNLLYKREYFFSLVNYSDNLFQMNDLHNSYNVAKEAYNFLEKNLKYLPQITLMNNLCILYLLKYKKLDTNLFDNCLGFINKIDINCENKSTYIMLCSNISSIYAYIEDFANALKYIKFAYKILENQSNAFSRYAYHLDLNYEIINYFINKKKPDFDKIFVKNEYQFDKYFKSDKLLNKQISVYKECFANTNSYNTLWELDEKLKEYNNLTFKNRWNAINKSVKFFTMQYWSK